MHESYHDKCLPIIQQKWQERIQANPGLRNAKPKVGFSGAIAKGIFDALPKQERDAIAARAKKEAADARAAYTAGLKQAPPTTPQARQE
jgi:hypothetical protein